MKHHITKQLSAGIVALTACIMLSACAASRTPEWGQWGGPNRNFIADGTGLSTSWPASGPKKMWSRKLGDGYATILADRGRLYTMYRDKENDVIVALDAKTGKTLWETPDQAPPVEGQSVAFGSCPRSTPLIVGHRLFTIGASARLNCLDKNSGNVLWTHDLVKDYSLKVPGHGYGASPIAYKNLVILPVGGEGHAVVAFNQNDGSVAWESQDFDSDYPSPILIDLEGETQLIIAMGNKRCGLNPRTGELKWQVELPESAGAMMSTPVWGDDGILFTSAEYSDGSRAFQITKEDGEYKAEELWYTRKMRVQHGSYVRVGDYVYGSSGSSTALLTGINVKTGKVAWRKRGFKKANCLYADGKLIILDEDGTLAIATATPDNLEIHSKVKVLKMRAWAAPTLVGTNLYIRDQETIMALDLS